MNGRVHQTWRRTYLLAILVRDDGAFRRTSIRAQDDAVLEETADNGGTGAGGLGQWDTALGQEVVPKLQVSVPILLALAADVPNFICEVKTRPRVYRCCRHVVLYDAGDRNDGEEEEEMAV